MKSVQQDTEAELAKIAWCVQRDPESWDEWLCLRVALPQQNDENKDENRSWAERLTESYLKGVEGKVFFCQDHALYVLCRDTPPAVLEQVSHHINETTKSDHGTTATTEIFSLRTQAQDFIHHVTAAYPHANKNVPTEILEKPLRDKEEPLKVLLVEDDPVTRWVVRESLKNKHDFATAATATEAMEKFSSWNPGVVLLDIDLPDKSGMEILHEMATINPFTTIVMFSSNKSLDHLTDALTNAATGFISKPFIKEKILHYIEKHEQQL